MGICTQEQYNLIRDTSIEAFTFAQNHLRERDIVLVDTKFEHGTNHMGRINVGDEVLTPDSSRYWKLEDGIIVLDDKGQPESYSKQFGRDMVQDVKKDVFSDQQRTSIAVRYIESYQALTGREFVPDIRLRDERIVDSTNAIVSELEVKLNPS